MKVLATIEGVAVIQLEDGSYLFWAPAMIDDDGTGPTHGDPDEQPATSYQPFLNADEDRYIVLPPLLFLAVAPLVLGCQAEVLNTLNGRGTHAVVGDRGPRTKIGEMAIATADAIGIPSSPTTGGISEHIILYRVWPGIPAVVNGKSYALQPYRS